MQQNEAVTTKSANILVLLYTKLQLDQIRVGNVWMLCFQTQSIPVMLHSRNLKIPFGFSNGMAFGLKHYNSGYY